MTDVPLIELRNVSKSYRFPGDEPIPVIQNINLTIQAKSFVTVLGRSGSGKSTLLNLISGLDQVSSGQITVAGVSLTKLTEDGLSRWRRSNVGVVFQFFQLLPTLTVLENVLLAMEISGTLPRLSRHLRAQQLLTMLEISEQAFKLPTQLSGGQQQRAAIARALANDPAILLADEPTGNLDSRTGQGVTSIFRKLVQNGKTVIMVTHDEKLASNADHIVHIADGAISESYERNQ